MRTAFDFLSSLLDEIALEGLDGITLKMLWQRLADRPEFPIAVDEDSISFFWNCVAKHKDIEIFELPEPRTFIPIYNRYDNIDPELGVVMESSEKVPDPYHPVVAVKDGEIRGSCSTYKTRKCITSEVRCGNDVLLMSLSQADEKWGDSLILVASPKLRLLSLIGTETNPLIDLSLEAYCLLERIGRSRYLGEVTQGEGGLLSLKASFCKQLHYYRKKLTLKGLITKQTHYMKTRKGNTSNGSLFHLTRFYIQRKTKMAAIMKKLCDILKEKPKNREVCMKLKEELQIRDRTFKKLFYRPFQKWVKVETIPCHEMYPDANRKEWFTMNGQEKVVKVVQLLRHCDDENDEEEEEDMADDGKKALPLNMHFDNSRIKCFVPLVLQVFQLVEEAGPDGISSSDIGRTLTLPRLDTRTLLRILIKKGCIITILQDRGRQKVTKYISKKFADQNEAYSSLKEQDVITVKETPVPEASKRKASDDEWVPEDEVPQKKKKKGENESNETALENGEVKEKAVNEVQAESNFQNIVSHVLEIQNKSHFTGKAPKLVSFSDQPVYPPPYSGTTQLTYRKLKRSNMIMDYLKTERFTTLSDLQKYIIEREREEGYSFKLDKKSTARLVYSLYNSKKIKIFKAVLKLEKEQTEIEFICDKSLESSDPYIQVAIEQAKFKYFSVSKDSATKKPQTTEIQPISAKSRPTKSETTGKSTGNEKSTKKAQSEGPAKYPSMTPKFRRTKALHLFLYYLVYEHKGDTMSSDEQRVYHDSMTWKRFVPPLPDYGKKGWCFLADIYTRMPLSLFVKVVNFRQGVPGLNQYLDSEEKSNYLIKFLPQTLRNSLLNNRKYLFSTNDVIRILCYMGLVSMGPQVGKQKDQVFLYIHKNASLKDTTISPAGYIHVQSDIEYETKCFEFKTASDIENFWLELESVCFHTPLGKFSAAVGKTIAITEANYKPELVETTKNKGFDEVTDVGTIPGDGLGAGGFDSVLFLHSRRNWQSSSGLKPQNALKDKSQSAHVSHSIQDLLKSKEAAKTEHKLQRLQRLAKSSLQLQKENKFKMKENSTKKAAAKAPPALSRSKKKTKLRTIKMRSVKKRSPYYDEKDKVAMEKLDKARCDWSNQEDSFLLLCKVASSFLEPYYNKNLVVPYTIVRDLLHEHVPGVSANKSSRACQRRLRYMMVNPTTIKNVSVFLGEAQQDIDLVKEFDKPKPPKSNVGVWQAMFTSVLKKLQEKFTLPASNRCKNLELPDSVEEFRKRFEFVSECDLSNPKRIYNDPKDTEDIKMFVLNSLVLSAMAIPNDGAQWSYLLHKLYQGYSEATLQAIVTHLRRERVIAVKKRSHRSDIQRSLRSTCPYKFSVTYNNAMLTKVPIKIFRESRELLDSLKGLSVEAGIELKGDVPPGYAAAVLSLVMMQQLSVHTKIPDQIILFDSSLSKEARSTIVERMINTLSDKESIELSRLLSNGSNALVQPNSEESERVHSAVVHEREIVEADLGVTSDSITQTSQLTEGQRFQNASRFALYLLRQEMSQPPIERVQHSQDYIILNSCRVFCRLKRASDEFVLPVNPPEIIQKNQGLDKMIESECISPNMVNLTQASIAEISKMLTAQVPLTVMTLSQNYLESLEALYKDYSPQTLLDGQNIFGYLYERKEGGIAESEVWRMFSKLSGELSLFEHLKLLRDGDLVLRVGVLSFSYVCSCFASSWVLKSFQMPGIFPTQENPSSKQDSEEGNSSFKSSISIITDFETVIDSSNKTVNDSDTPIFNENSCVNECFVPNGTTSSVESQEQDLKIHPLLDAGVTTVHFIPRTWRNPDGSLNKPVFFTLLSTVLSHIISFPAVSSTQVCEQFLQVMPPVQTLELIELLEKASCVYRYYCKPVKKCSLFSKTSTFFITENPEPDDIDHLESFPDAVIKIAKLRDSL